MITATKKKSVFPALVISIVTFGIIAVFVLVMLNNAMKTSGDEALKTARNSVIRAAVSCYAYEGRYPDSLEYLEENYSLIIDKKRYIVHYEKIADNLMPSVIVKE